jgi:septum site-determining protein MinC
MSELTIKAVRQGMVVAVPEALAWDAAVAALDGKLLGAGGLVAGQKAQLLLGARALEAMELGALVGRLARAHQLEITAVVASTPVTRAAAEACGLQLVVASWAEGLEEAPAEVAPSAPPAEAARPESAAEPAELEAPSEAEAQAPGGALAWASVLPEGVGELRQALYLRQTVRSGQMVRHDGTILIAGDVNPGAEVVATGDIIVFGNLRGLAHAGAAGDGEAQIIAVNLRPTQIRIAGFTARSPDQGAPPLSKHPEVARVQDGEIHITPLKDLA